MGMHSLYLSESAFGIFMAKLLEIETARLSLRPCRESDIDDLHRLWTDPQVRKYLWDDVIITREQAAEVVSASLESFERNGFGQWVVSLKESDSLIGFCGFRFFGDPPEVEILYGLAPAHWGKGFATEAAKAMMRCGFEENGFERIYAGADPPNAASFRVMENCRMKFAKRILINEQEAVYYELSRAEFEPDDSSYIARRE